MSIPTDLKYSTSHEWVRLEGDIATCGITHHAQDALGDVVFVDVPELGDDVTKGEGAAEIESVKAVSDIYAPVSGEVVEINEAIEDGPEIVNADPYGKGWLFKVRITANGEVASLMDAQGYEAHLSAS
jgi:glycine cleavage system H protein